MLQELKQPASSGMTARNRKRALLDLTDLQQCCTRRRWEYAAVDDEDGLQTVHVTIDGPDETPYVGGRYVVRCQLPATYPLDSPSIAFKTMIWHPNIEKESGAICLDVLQKRWSPVTRLSDVFEVYIPQLLQCPNGADPFNAAAAAMMKDNEKEYTEFVRLHTAKHARSMDVELPDITGAYDFVEEEEDD
jgi:ubiquitin-conjugating enzyme E2 H